jgi:hypothetical protein
MASSKEEGTAAAAEQLGSISLGESVEKKDSAGPNVENGTTPTKLLCSACGKKSDALKKCRNCKCVWYCDKECQNKHWKEHKVECRRIKKQLDEREGKLDLGTEKDVGPLGKLPPREECPICMHVLPIHSRLQSYFACCGNSICSGCCHQHCKKSLERAEKPTCAFCRELVSKSDEEVVARLHKRVLLKDPKALSCMALHYRDGGLGLQVDQTKCVELMRQSADLGNPDAHYQLGIFHLRGEMGLQPNEEEAIKHWKQAAEGGQFLSQHSMGRLEEEHGDYDVAMRHWRLSASGGYRRSMESLIECFERGFLQHGDLAETLRAFYLARAEMKTKDRDDHIAFLKWKGEYKGEGEM